MIQCWELPENEGKRQKGWKLVFEGMLKNRNRIIGFLLLQLNYICKTKDTRVFSKYTKHAK